MSVKTNRVSEMGVFRFEKVTVVTQPKCEEIEGEYYLVLPYIRSFDSIEDKFLALMLAKRFWQIDSLINTSPRNIFNKLTSKLFVEKLEVSDVILLEHVHIYIWNTSRGTTIYLIPPDLVLFKTNSNKRYIVRINLSVISSKLNIF